MLTQNQPIDRSVLAAAALEALNARHTRVVTQIAVLRAALQALDRARRLLSRKERERLSERMKQVWSQRRRKRRTKQR